MANHIKPKKTLDEFSKALVTTMEREQIRSVRCLVSVTDNGFVSGRGYTFSRDYVSDQHKFSDIGYDDNRVDLGETLANAVDSIQIGPEHRMEKGPIAEKGKTVSQYVHIINAYYRRNEQPQPGVETPKTD